MAPDGIDVELEEVQLDFPHRFRDAWDVRRGGTLPICTCGTSDVKKDGHCLPRDGPNYRHMGRFRVMQFMSATFARHDYVFTLDVHSGFGPGTQLYDPVRSMLRDQAVFGYYSHGTVGSRACAGPVREWALDIGKEWGLRRYTSRAFVEAYGETAKRCRDADATGGPERYSPSNQCGIKIDTYSGDVVVFKTSFVRSPAVQKFVTLWDDTGASFHVCRSRSLDNVTVGPALGMCYKNRSSEQVLWPSLFGLLAPANGTKNIYSSHVRGHNSAKIAAGLKAQWMH